VRKIRLINFFRAYSDSSHHIAAVNALESLLPDELLDKESDWVVCFEAEDEANPKPARYTM